MSASEWKYALEYALRSGYASIANQPEYLFEQDMNADEGYFEKRFGHKFHYINARLIGMDDDVIADLHIHRILPELLAPIPQDISCSLDIDVMAPTFKVARYVQQNTFATLAVSADFLPPGMAYDRFDYRAHILMLRYKRRI